jgi:alpha-L-rhamnosidase
MEETMIHILQMLLLLATVAASTAAPSACGMRAVGLRTNNLINPLGVALEKPKLSWAFEETASGGKKNQHQSAYRIEASSKAGGPPDLWDSGTVKSSESLQIVYGGQALKQMQVRSIEYIYSITTLHFLLGAGSVCYPVLPGCCWCCWFAV